MLSRPPHRPSSCRWLLALVITSGCARTPAPPVPLPTAPSTTPPAVPPIVVEASPASPLPALPEILVAVQTWNYELVILHLHDSRVEPEVVTKRASRDWARFGWLDPQTLVYHETSDDDRSVVHTYAHGVATLELELDKRWLDAKLLITTAGEAWLERCVDDDCERSEYRRAVPAPHVSAKTRPVDHDPLRVAYGTDTSVRHHLVPAVAPPAGVTIESAALGPNQAGVRCTQDGRSSTYPTSVHRDLTRTTDELRWVHTDPPVYEVSSTLDASYFPEPKRLVEYHVPCRPEPLGGFISFGDGRWAEYIEAAHHEDGGAWVFRRGSVELGRYDHGPGQVRSNQVPERVTPGH